MKTIKNLFKLKETKINTELENKKYTYNKINSIVSELNKFRCWIDDEIKENIKIKTYDKGYNIALKRVEENLEALNIEIIRMKYKI